jgi:predicted DCC family thiol-disulfide oxidoreductase YuxK
MGTSGEVVTAARRSSRGRNDGPILFYDGECKLCMLTARLVLAADTAKRLRTATLDSPQADRYLGDLSRKERYGAFHLYRDGRVLSGGDAVAPLLELVAPLRAAGRFLGRSDRTRELTGRLYRAIARRRAMIGRFLPRVGPPPR